MIHRKRSTKALSAVLSASLLLPAGGCINGPRRSADHLHDLKYLEAHGHSMDELDHLPATPWLATLLTFFPPGLGLYLEGEIGNGIKTTLLFWLVYPMICGPIAAHSAASYEN